MAPSATEQTDVTYEDLIQLEQEFEDADLQIIRQQYKITQPLYKKRQDVISKLPNFWALVFEQVPPELDNFIQPSDSSIFADCLKSIEVTRFEIDDPAGSPRSFSVKFGFGPNKYFDNEVLEKKFWYRRALDGWSGLVSEPVKINWKKGQDVTEGLTDAAVELFEARKTLSAEKVKSEFKKLPQYKKLLEKMELSEEGTLSFFTFFGFVSARPFVTAEESAKATKKEAEDRAKRSRGEKVEETSPEDEEDEEIQLFAEESEVFPTGDELATLIAEDIWPNAIKYFTSAQEADDDDLSSIEDIEDIDVDDDEDEPVDIRALVGKGKKEKNGESSPPAKKRRT
ncbi:Nap family protein [Lasiodiplodia theobromae]|uniref:Putative nucleosome assembly protein n=1 Tax=Lasiodiplodia theobromae TaxID=45133 RepID=A0A5N5DN63_9PEZI|nr:Nap family protein [Lasiodiplodia theobromae]KAB2578264.1 putative nucleosome assembly protein [Lasiodiplodia theobromae]KAF4544199.1 Nap family protein [Lasiodiplodia theobromae]